MPSGKVHDSITVITTIAAVPAYYLLTSKPNAVALATVLGAYVFSGFWFSDDLDTHSVAYKRWGPFRFLWWPYQKLVPHRSWISHGVGVGPILRVAYFVMMLWLSGHAVLWWLHTHGVGHRGDDVMLDSLGVHGLAWTLAHPTVSLWILTGLILGGLEHSVVDGVVSFVKKVW